MKLPKNWEKVVFHLGRENLEWSAEYFVKEAENGKIIKANLPVDDEFRINLGNLIETRYCKPPCDLIFFSNGKYKIEVPNIKHYSMRDIELKIDELRRIDLKTADIDDLKRQLQFIRGYTVNAPIIPEGSKIYRGVIWEDKPQKVDKLSYPPKCKADKLHRAGRPGNPLFYCSSEWDAIFFELGVKTGDKLVIST